MLPLLAALLAGIHKSIGTGRFRYDWRIIGASKDMEFAVWILEAVVSD